MSNLKKNLSLVKEKIASRPVTIIAASKTYSLKEIKALYQLGITDFGENRAEDLLTRKQHLKDLAINWHFIGHLQSNKVKTIINEIDYLHSLDRISLAKEINKRLLKPLKCFIQINVFKEKNKSGVYLEELEDFLTSLKKYDKIEIVGFMALGVYHDLSKTKTVFETLLALKNKTLYPELSMGMSADYELALQYQATFIRLGRLLVGSNYE